MDALQIAKYLISNYQGEETNITHLKLQKLLYYIYVWSLVSEMKFFNGNFHKWEHGPVNPQVYESYKYNNSNVIPNHSLECIVSLSSEQVKLVDFVVKSYGKFSAKTLSAMTHQDTPWKITNKNEVIGDESLLNFYSSLNYAKNFPIDYENNPYYPVETDSHYSFVLDFSDKDYSFYYNSFNEYLKLSKKAKKDINKIFLKLSDPKV